MSVAYTIRVPWTLSIHRRQSVLQTLETVERLAFLSFEFVTYTVQDFTGGFPRTPYHLSTTGGFRLSRIFWEHENLRLKSNPANPVIFSLVYIEKLPWQKIQLNQESGLTDVWLKRDLPVLKFKFTSSKRKVNNTKSTGPNL